ncbi:DeoR family transcriptional regulator [Lentzea pudingi]|uniref:DeoR family transcriptional regulator n=1 Tax=Lentzea pudingi TaxID=1789439 RepID=A0ABQ2HW42_9PSEU|nr:DeoR/GlpR family DNA-binding transcription regulator [Lentzea pudingi]GGM91024.1 DeoR family transcriptional regulator [Lentzea pudingi]
MSRLKQITEAVRDAGSLGVADLATLTGASEMTIRRDLEILAAQGVLERYRGGARSLLLRGSEPPFALRSDDNTAAKRRIASVVAGLIADGESVVLDSGTTCLEVARLLHDRRVTVMPLSLHAVNALSSSSTVTLLVPGGRPRPGELALTGPLTLASVQALRFDTAVIGCCGLSAEHGLTAFDLEDASVKRAAITSARRVIAAVDASKLTRTALAHVAAVSSLDAVVTDAEGDDGLTAAGVTVVTA